MKKIGFSLLAVLTLLTSGGATLALADGGELLYLPIQKVVFPLLWADPRSAQFKLQVYDSGSKTLSKDSIGHQINLIRYTTEQGNDLQLGLEASAFIDLNLTAESGNASLSDSDWYFGFPIEYRQGHWAFRLYGYHTSSHLGDNYITAHNATPIVYSREAAEALISYSFKYLTIYGGGSRAIHTIPIVDTTATHAGFQAWSKPLDAKGTTKLYAAADFQPKAEVNWQIQTNTEAGFAITPPKSLKTMRIYVDYAAGPEPEGQFYDHARNHFVAAGLAFDFR